LWKRVHVALEPSECLKKSVCAMQLHRSIRVPKDSLKNIPAKALEKDVKELMRRHAMNISGEPRTRDFGEEARNLSLVGRDPW